MSANRALACVRGGEQHQAVGMRPTDRESAEFLAGYLEAAAWCGIATSEGKTRSVATGELPADFREQAEADCAEFLTANLPATRAWRETVGEWRGPVDGCGNDHYSATECAGHDFYLTRNGHGTGFWDRDAGAVGEQLSAAARRHGEHLPIADADPSQTA